MEFYEGSSWLGLLGVTKKVSGRGGHNSVALPMAEGRREGDRICPALTKIHGHKGGRLLLIK